jgi:FkbM family methyltransferase
MQIYIKTKQYYRYLRNWKKFRDRKATEQIVSNTSKQLDFYSQFINTGNLVFDIGANVGDKTDLFLKLGAKVVAVEPQESCWRVLKHRFNKNVYIEPVALAGKRGSGTLFVDSSTTISSVSKDWIEAVKQSGRFSNHKWAYKLPVQTTTLDNLIDKYGQPAFCKIDVEGAEFDVLQGLSRPIKVISFEFVSERIEPSLDCIDYLSNLGKTEFNYYLGDVTSFALSSWVGANEMKTILTLMNKDIKNYGDIYVRFTPVGFSK